MFKLIITTAEISDNSLIKNWQFDFRLFTVPMIKKVLSYDSEVEHRIFELGRTTLNAFFTSEVAVRAVFERLEETPDWRIFCLNGKTRATLLKFIPESFIEATAPNSTLLSAFIKDNPENIKERASVFFCGNRRMPTLPTAFEQLNIPLEELICYKTSCETGVVNGDFHAFLFFSPSAVECFFTQNPQMPPSAVLFAVGATTAKSIAAHCSNKIIVASAPSEKALLNEVKIYFEALKLLEKESN